MTVYAFPTLTRRRPSTLQWGVLPATQFSRSPLSKQIQSQGLPGDRQAFSAGWTGLDAADAGKMQAFLAKLRGFANRFTAYDWSKPAPRGTIAGTLQIKGSGQSGLTIACDGVGSANTLLEGDLVGINGELHLIAADCTADPSGNLTLTLAYPVRATPPDDSLVTYVAPTGKFMLVSQDVRWTVRPPFIADFTIEAIEMF